MKAPEKIYIHPDIGGKEFISPWLIRRVSKESVEYTRTDAVIEKAVEYIANNMRCDGYTLQTKAKFIKEFRNYLKGDRT